MNSFSAIDKAIYEIVEEFNKVLDNFQPSNYSFISRIVHTFWLDEDFSDKKSLEEYIDAYNRKNNGVCMLSVSFVANKPVFTFNAQLEHN